jgi:OFA family oxalate/formate antiporter-like MFS transporter
MKNRWVQLSASLVAMIMIANLQYAWTLFVKPIQTTNHWRLSEVQWAFTLFILCETWVMPMEGWLIDRIGPRLFTTIAGVLCGTGWTGLAFAHTLGHLYLFYAIAGVGAAFIYSGSIASALKWFPDRRGLAAGIIAGGFGSGSALFIPLIQHIILTRGYADAFLFTGIGQGLIILVVAQMLRHPDAEYIRAHTAAQIASPKRRRGTAQFTTIEMLRTPHFYLLYGMFVLMATGGLLVTAQAGPVAKEWNITLTALTAALALDRISNGFSRVFWGWASDHLGREKTMAVAFVLQAGCLASVMWLGRRSGAWFTATLVATFFTYGEVFSLFPAITGDYFGAKNAASNYSFMYSAKGIASIIGGGVAAILFEKTGTWSGALYGSAVFALVAAGIAVGLRTMPLPVKREVLAEAAQVQGAAR